MEKETAIVYFKYKISYTSLINRDCMPIYDGKEVLDNRGTVGLKPIGHVFNPLSNRKEYIPREFETKEEAESVCAELEKNGMFRNWQIERILDHIEIL